MFCLVAFTIFNPYYIDYSKKNKHFLFSNQTMSEIGVLAEDGKKITMDVKVGDKVLFGKWSGTEVKIDGKEYSIMKESDIMGISSK